MIKLLITTVLVCTALNADETISAQPLNISTKMVIEKDIKNSLYIDAGKGIKRELTKEDRKILLSNQEALNIENVVIIKSEINLTK